MDVTIFPNPNSGAFTVELNSNEAKTVDINISNMLGASVYSNKNINVNGKQTLDIDANDLSEGLYYLNIENQTGRIVKKLIVTK